MTRRQAIRLADLPGPLPPEVPGGPDRYTTPELREWFDAGVAELTDAYDARNGNPWFGDWYEETRRMTLECFTPHRIEGP